MGENLDSRLSDVRRLRKIRVVNQSLCRGKPSVLENGSSFGVICRIVDDGNTWAKRLKKGGGQDGSQTTILYCVKSGW